MDAPAGSSVRIDVEQYLDRPVELLHVDRSAQFDQQVYEAVVVSDADRAEIDGRIRRVGGVIDGDRHGGPVLEPPVDHDRRRRGGNGRENGEQQWHRHRMGYGNAAEVTPDDATSRA